MRWTVLLAFLAAVASGAGVFWYQHSRLANMQAALAEAQIQAGRAQRAYAALQAAYDEQRTLYEQADKQALDRLNTLDQQAGDWGAVCLPAGIGRLFCVGSTGANSDASGEPHAGNGGSRLDAGNK